MKTIFLTIPFLLLLGGCAVTFTNRSIVHNVEQRAEYDGSITSNPTDSSSGSSSVAAEKTTSTSVSESGSARSSKGN